MAVCPNKNDKNWKKLEEHLGHAGAMAAFRRNGDQIPDYTKAPNGKKSILFEEIKDNFGEKKAYEVKFKINSPNFRQWFGDSKVVDKNGEPKVVYHGTKEEFEVFDPNLIGTSFGGQEGFYFTDMEEDIDFYSGGVIMPVFLKITNPSVEPNETRDGIIDVDEFVVFSNDQIKSIFNRGTFNVLEENIYKQKESTSTETLEDFTLKQQILSNSLNVDVQLNPELTNPDTGEPIAAATIPGEKASIRVNPNYMGGDTLIHEYGHIYIDLLGGMDNPMIRQGRKYLEGSKLEGEITAEYEELSGELLDKEILATSVGREGEQIFDGRKKGLIERFTRWLDLFFNRLRKAIGLEYNVAKELARQLLSNQVLENLKGQVTDIQLQKAYSQQYVADRQDRLIEKIIDSLRTKIAQFNKVMRSNKASDKSKKEAAESLQDLVKEMAQYKDYQSLTKYVKKAYSQTELMKRRIREMEESFEEVSAPELRQIASYAKSFSYLQEIRDLLRNNADLKGRFSDEIMNQEDKQTLLDRLNDSISNYNEIQDGYISLGKQLMADAYSKSSNGRIHIQKREEFEGQFDQLHKRKHKFLGKDQFMLNGKRVSEEDYKNARRDWVNQQMTENAQSIQAEEKAWLLRIFEEAPSDIGGWQEYVMDPAVIGDDIVQIVHEKAERADHETMMATVTNFKDSDDLFKEFIQERDFKDQKKRYDEMISEEIKVTKDGDPILRKGTPVTTGKKSQWLVTRYYPQFYEIHQDFRGRKAEMMGEFAITEDNLVNIKEDDYSRLKKIYEDNKDKEDYSIEYNDKEVGMPELGMSLLNYEHSNWISRNTRKVGNRRYPSKKWQNPQFDKLKELEKQDSVIYRMYDHIRTLDRQTDKNYPDRAKKIISSFGTEFHRMPAIEKSAYERVFEKGFIEAVKGEYDDITKVRASEFEFRPEQVEEQDLINSEAQQRIIKRVADESQLLLKNVPVRFRGEVGRDEQSYDVLSNALIDNTMSHNFANKTDMLADVQILHDIASVRDVRETKSGFWGTGIFDVFNKSDRPIIKEGDQSKAYSALTSLIESRFYGIQKTGSVGGHKFAQVMNRWVGHVFLGVNYFAAGANEIHGNTMSLIESHGGNLVSKTDMRKGIGKYNKDMGGLVTDVGRRRIYSKTNLLMELLNVKGDWTPHMPRFSEERRWKQLAKPGTSHFMTNMAEHNIHGNAMYSGLNTFKVKNKNGEYIGYDDDGNVITVDKPSDAMSIDEAMKVEAGRLKFIKQAHSTNFTGETPLGDDPYNSPVMPDIMMYLREMVKDTQGNFSSIDISQASRHWVMNLVEVLRRWIPRGVERRWKLFSTVRVPRENLKESEKFYSRAGRRSKSGIYTDTGRYVIEVWRGIKESGKILSSEIWSAEWDKLSEREVANIRKTSAELALAALTWAGANVLLALTEGLDEDDEAAKRTLKYTTFFTRRLYSELIFYINPRETTKILESPAASLSIINDVIHLATQVSRDFPFFELEKYQRGRRKGQAKILKDIGDIVPVTRQIDREVDEALGWLFMENTY